MDAIETLISEDDSILKVYNVITLQMGAQGMLAAKTRLREGLEIEAACEKINRLEVRLKERFPEIGRCFVEPDVAD